MKFHLGVNFSSSDKGDLFWKLQAILIYIYIGSSKQFFYIYIYIPLLFNSGRLAWGIRWWNTAKLFLKLHPKPGYSTPTAVAGFKQGHISSPGFSLGRGRIREECHTKDWPLASSRMLNAVCTVFPSDQPTCGTGWALGEGTRQELIRFPSFEVKNGPEWRSFRSKAAGW